MNYSVVIYPSSFYIITLIEFLMLTIIPLDIFNSNYNNIITFYTKVPYYIII